MLDVKDLSIEFGGLKAVSDFNLSIEDKQVVGLIGPNGAGKTTVFNMLTGVYAPTNGTIIYLGIYLGLKPYHITLKKICRTFQNIRLFSSLSVIDNVKLSFNFTIKYNLFDSILRTPRFKRRRLKLKKNH